LKRGFSLANTVILSAFITIIGLLGLIVVNFNLKSTRAEARYQIAEKAANAGFIEAANLIQTTGFCDINQTLSGSVGDGTYTVEIRRSGRICFIRSEGRIGDARVVKTGIIQAYYGVGLYTVRGNVDAFLGSDVRLSGCDYDADPVCVVPAFIASGTISTTLTPRNCCSNDNAGLVGCAYTDPCIPADNGGNGLYGNPAIVSGVQFHDLIPLFFNANCFNTFSDPNCDVGLLQIFEEEYGINPTSNNQDMYFDNEWGIPRIDLSNLNPVVDQNCIASGDNDIDLSTEYTNCTDIVVEGLSNEPLHITGLRDSHVTIYVLNQFNNSDVDIYVNTYVSPEGFTLYSHFRVFLGTGYYWTDYTKYYNWFEDSYSFSVTNARLILANNLYTDDDGIIFRNSVIIIAPENIEDTNNPDADYRLFTGGDITLDRSVLFVKNIRFGSYSDVNFWDSLVYMYAYACPNCSRSSSTSSLQACRYSDIDWCGWYGRYITLNIGRDYNGNERPTILISNNSTVHTEYPIGTVYIWGAFVGQDVTYLSWYNSGEQNYKGFLIRNFPPNLTLQISIYGGFTMEFSKRMLDILAENFWFFRKVNCIRDDISVKTQLIQTRATTY